MNYKLQKNDQLYSATTPISFLLLFVINMHLLA